MQSNNNKFKAVDNFSVNMNIQITCHKQSLNKKELLIGNLQITKKLRQQKEQEEQ